MRITTLPLLATLAAASLLANPARAVDGVIEINMNAATLGGITAGDTAGLPITLSEAGSYVLTGNLETASQNQTVIEITSSFVTIDLNGFTISGPGLNGTGNGISVSGSGIYHATVRNGKVTGMGSGGIRLSAPYSTVEHVHARGNFDDGIQLGINGVVRHSVASNNGDVGISVSTGGSVLASAASQNGFNTGFGTGIFVGNGGSVVDSTARSNTGEGIVAGTGVSIHRNALFDNSEDGVRAGEGSLAINNTARGNTGFGLNLGDDSGFGGNVLTNNGAGSVTSGHQIASNVCEDVTTC